MITAKDKALKMKELLKVSLPIKKVLDTYFNSKKEGNFYFCPLHPHTSRATLRITPNGTGYNCFHCKSHGTVLNLLYDAAKLNIINDIPLTKDYSAFIVSVFNHFDIPLPYSTMETEFETGVTPLGQLDAILERGKLQKVVESEDTTTMQMLSTIRQFKTNTITPDELIDFFYLMQSGETTSKELMESFSHFESFEDMINFEEDFQL